MEFDGLMPWLCPARFCVAGKGPVFCAGVAACLPSLVPRTRTSPRRRAPSRPLGLETSFDCLRPFSALHRLRPARNRPRSETPILLVPAHRRHRIERHHSSVTGVSQPRENTRRSRGTTMRRRHRLRHMELPASTQRTNRQRAAKSSIRMS